MTDYVVVRRDALERAREEWQYLRQNRDTLTSDWDDMDDALAALVPVEDATARLADAEQREDAFTTTRDAFYDYEGPEQSAEHCRLWDEYETAMSAIVAASRERRPHDAG